MADELEKDVNSLLNESPVETPEVKEEPKEQLRDETGKFAPKEPTEIVPKVEPKAESVAPVNGKTEPAKEDDDKGQVPSWRLREVAEERRTAQAERDSLRTQLAEMQGRLRGLEKPAEQPKQEPIDPLLDPEGFTKRIQDGFNQRLAETQLNSNLAIAHVRHGDKFEKAYGALIAEAQGGNRQLIPALTSQANPGEAIVRWYSDKETLREVGSDPASYKQKLLDDALKDPTYLAKAIEAAKVAAGQPRTNNITQLPPSLSRTTGSSANDADAGELLGVEALLQR